MDNEQTFEEVVEYLRNTHMAKIIVRELVARREAALGAVSYTHLTLPTRDLV